MSRVKLGYATGYNLVFAAFQPDGTGRGEANQTLPEIRPTGFYTTTSAVDLVDGDVVLVYNLETVTWEGETVVCLAYESVFWEGEQVYWEGETVIDYDSTTNDIVTWVGETVGSGEYVFTTGNVTTIVENTETLIVEAQRVQTTVDETQPAKQVVILKNI
jgi:hypothetical protein